MEPVTVNRKAKFDYFLYDRVEAGLALLGSEVKSIREGKVNLQDGYVRILRGEAYLCHCHIPSYSKMQGHVDLDPLRDRKLLLHREEIARLAGQISKKGFSCVPVSLYFKKGRAKVEIAVAKGKKQYDKRETLKRKIHDREAAAAIKRHSRKSR